jgi:hypothetical protein
MMYIVLVPFHDGEPRIPEGWSLRREGNTPFFSLYAGERRPENRAVLQVLADTPGLVVCAAHVEDPALERALPLLEQVPFVATVEELRNPRAGQGDENWRTLRDAVRAAWAVEFAQTMSGVDPEERASRATRERLQPPGRPTELPEPRGRGD